MSRFTWRLWCAAVLPTAAFAWQSESPAITSQRPFQPGPRAAAGPHAPISTVSRDGAPMPQLVPLDAAAPVVQIELLDDSIPLPEPPVYQPGADGDVLVAPASGDPFFLGFAAGKHYPPAGELVDPLLAASARTSYADGRPQPETYAFAMFDERITPERVAELETLGARVLGVHPHYSLKLALPASSIDAVAAHPAVRWIGVPRAWQKVHPALSSHLEACDPNRPVEVWINLFESDLGPQSSRVTAPGGVAVGPDGALMQGAPIQLADVWITRGWMQSQLERVGVEVLDYSERIQAHRALMMPQSLESLVALDFVQFVEWLAPATSMHDESMGMINADDTRNFWNGGTNSRAVAGIVDSGIEDAHNAIGGIWGVGWDESGAGDAWADTCNHGTHVCGTMLGEDAANPGLKGAAFGLGWGATGRLFNVRIFNGCSGSVTVSNILSHTSTAFNDGTNTTPQPHVTNNSWGTSPGGTAWVGTEADPRLYDDTAWSGAQLNVFAAGNSGSGAGTVGQQGTAKNVLTVANVLDYNDAVEGPPGSIRSTSSRGPCGDGRWKPNVAAPGRWIRSADATDLDDYFDNTGTSMAAPHVTGLASLLIDQSADYVYLPERISAHLMATAVPKDDFLYTFPSDTPLDNYGTGRVDGTRAIWSSGGSNTSWAFSLGSGASTNADFTLPAGATRLIVVMHYVEQSASAGASQALVNNWNLYIDQPPVDTASNGTGDYVVQQSSIDNTEIRVISNPIAGTWRWKAWPASTTSTAYFGVTVYALTADVTPDVNLNVTATDTFITPGQQIDISASASTTGATASAVFLNSTSVGDALVSSSTTLLDGVVTNLMTNQHLGRDVTLGNLDPFFGRTATWRTSWATEGIKSWSVTAMGDNFADPTDAVSITVDGTLPGLVTNLTSSTHTVNVWSNNSNITYTWTAATDNLSGIDGYGVFTATVPSPSPSNFKDIEEVTMYSETLGDLATWHFGIRSVDNCGNWDDAAASVGPFKIDTVAPTQPGVISSTTHTLNLQSCSTTVTVNWTASTDALSGLQNYWGVWNTIAVFDPVAGTNIAPGSTSNTTNIGSSTSARYFHLRPRDNAGNYGPTRHFGPIYANAASVLSYCTAKTNSLGCLPAIGSVGQPDKSAGTFRVTCSNVLNQKNGIVFWGFGSLAVPFQGGTLCVAAPTIRTDPQNSGGSALPANNCTGTYSFMFTTAYLNLHGVVEGDTLYAQWWTRDPASPSTTGLSNGIQFTVCQ